MNEQEKPTEYKILHLQIDFALNRNMQTLHKLTKHAYIVPILYVAVPFTAYATMPHMRMHIMQIYWLGIDAYHKDNCIQYINLKVAFSENCEKRLPIEPAVLYCNTLQLSTKAIVLYCSTTQLPGKGYCSILYYSTAISQCYCSILFFGFIYLSCNRTQNIYCRHCSNLLLPHAINLILSNEKHLLIPLFAFFTYFLL